MNSRMILGAVAALAACSGVSAAERLTRIDGNTAEVAVSAITGERVTLANGEVAFDDLWRIERMAPSAAVSGKVARVVLEGGEIPVLRVIVTNGICRFDWVGENDAALTQSVVRALLLATGEATARAGEGVWRRPDRGRRTG